MTAKKKNLHTPPSFLDPIAKAIWKERIPQLLERGDIQDADLIHLELYCVQPLKIFTKTAFQSSIAKARNQETPHYQRKLMQKK